MVKSLLALCASFFAKGSVDSAKAFLDYEQRPGAVAIEKSFVSIDYIGGDFEVIGGLGSIPSSFREGEYVGFSGVEISKDLFAKSKSNEDLIFNFKNIGKEFKILTVQLVVGRGFSKKLYAIDLDMKNLSKSSKIKWKDFKESFRGRIGDASYNGNGDSVLAVRFFLKRSSNAPKSQSLLDYHFKLSNLAL